MPLKTPVAPDNANPATRQAAMFCGIFLLGFSAAYAQGVPPPPSSQQVIELPPRYPGDLSAELRDSIDKVVVISGRGPAGQEVGGTYEKETYGLVGGMAAGNQRARISKQVGPVPIDIPIPVLTLPATIIGGLAGSVQRQIQEFRDTLTEEIVNSDSPALTDDGLALDVFWGLRRLPDMQSKLLAPDAEIDEDTDAILYVSFGDIGIDVQGKEAIITTSANVTLSRSASGAILYESTYHYRDRDTLKNWTDNGNAAWRAYTNFARYYLGREISAALFDRAQVEYELVPVATGAVKRDRKNKQQFNARSAMPTLSWELTLPAADRRPAWASAVNEQSVFYDLEIYDANRPVYTAEQLPDPSHALAYEIEPCHTYRWSVRPSFHVDGKVRYGEWMRFPSPGSDEKEVAAINGLSGRAASVAPAYTQDFPLLKIACGKR